MYIAFIHSYRALAPRTTSVWWHLASKIKLTTNGRIRTTSVREVVRIKGHEMGKDIVCASFVPRLPAETACATRVTSYGLRKMYNGELIIILVVCFSDEHVKEKAAYRHMNSSCCLDANSFFTA